MGDLENKQNFDFGAEISTTRTMLAVNGKQSPQQQQHQKQQSLHHENQLVQKQQQYVVEEEMNERKVVEQQVLRGGATEEKQQQETQTNIEMKTKILDKFEAVNDATNNIVLNGINDGKNQEENSNESGDLDEEDNTTSSSSMNASDINEDLEANNESLSNEAEGASQNGNEVDSDESSSDSDFSDLSGLSDVSGREWKPMSARPLQWVQKQIHSGANPREILSQILPNAHQLPAGLNDMALWRLLATMLSEPPRRQKLRSVNTFSDVINLVRKSTNIIVLTGAGVSVSCGIPDFRSSDGIYSRLAKDYPDLPDPQAMFDINYFSRDPRPFYKFAREIYPGQFRPSPCHRFIKLLEDKKKLLRNYTQNIDTLEQVAGIQNVIECHGSFSTASCTKCKFKCDADAIRPDIFAQRIPVCPRCQPNVQQSVDASEPVSTFELRQLVENGIMKPDIVFFGEGLPEEFHTVMASDRDKCDLLIVIGSSLKVRPVALIPSSIPPHVPQILINREQLHHLEFDVELLGDSDVIINQLCHCLGKDWQQICYDDNILKECRELLPFKDQYDDDSQDNDTQSLESNTSNEMNQATTASIYMDSGFESSASSTTNAAINSNKSTTNENCQKLGNNSSAGTTTNQVLPPELIEGPNDCHTFAERLELPPPTNATTNQSEINENCRHYSVDSTKDSGIGQYCGESSNSSALTPPLTTNNEPANVKANEEKFNNFAGCSKSSVGGGGVEANVGEESAEAANLSASIGSNNKMAMPSSSDCLDSKPKNKEGFSMTFADRLPMGFYYYHERTCSYVFPGAQVTWPSESEEGDFEENDIEDEVGVDDNEDECEDLEGENDDDDEDADEEEEDDEEENAYCDEDKDESSNLMNEAEDDTCEYSEEGDDENAQDASSSVEREISKHFNNYEERSANSFNNKQTCIKRHSNGYIDETTDCLTSKQKCLLYPAAEISTPPPNKKSRNSYESSSEALSKQNMSKSFALTTNQGKGNDLSCSYKTGGGSSSNISSSTCLAEDSSQILNKPH